ncbi:ABC transporter ATP-binding protein [Ruminiclostridium herbifermentans]|uniref:ABC transporter ATP-binding protein n=2 Tax=Ruminiclostridium herbifermentans TaxID=2488810 RepID=A0A4U7JFB1_9FIRM|nr:ABC transporter ATP-binding protein [Ruminiclostridium herbifermentans]
MVFCENLVKIYKTKDIEVVALQGLDLTIEKGEMMAIIGNSGSGKSTLLNMLGGLDRPSAGKLIIDGKDLLKFTEKQMVDYKLKTVGFVWQNNARNLIPYLTALENVEIPLILARKRNVRRRALEILEMVGLSHRKNNKLHQLSGGEQQRIAIAIGVVNHPKILLADEPTGSVDAKSSGMILDIFRELNKTLGITIIIVTHDRQFSKKVDRVVSIRDGRTSSEFIRAKSYAEELEESLNSQINETHVELAVLDRAGRLQIPKEYIELLGMTGKNKIRVETEGNRIILLNPDNV